MSRKTTGISERERYRREILSTFEKLSGRYDLCARLISLGTIGRVRRATAAMLYLHRSARVLDICTGTGETAIHLHQAGLRPVGIDFSPPMLRRAMRKESTAGIPLIHGDALRLPFGDDSFDGATITFGLHEMPEGVMDEAMEEIARVLKPGGSLVITDWNLPPNRLLRALFNPLINLFETRYCRGFLDRDLAGFLNERGFRLKEQQLIGFGCAAIRSFQVSGIDGHDHEPQG